MPGSLLQVARFSGTDTAVPDVEVISIGDVSVRLRVGEVPVDIVRYPHAPLEAPKLSHVEQKLAGAEGPVVAATDYIKLFAEQIRPFVKNSYVTLGTDGFGRSDTREKLRHLFEVDRRWVAVAALKALADDGVIERGKVADWDRMIDVNLKGVLYGIAAALPHMARQKGGHIINVSSVAGHKVRPGSAVYAATKTAVRVLSEGLRQEVKPYGIRTTIISPGAVESELVDSVTEADVAAGIREFYERTAIPAEAFARMVAFAIAQPEEVDVNEILFRPTAQEL